MVTFGQDMSVHRNKGFTLIESLMVILVMAIVAALAVPGLQQAQANARARAAAGDLVTALLEARNQAAGKQRPVSLTSQGGWQNGWIMAFELPLPGVPDLAAHRGVADTVTIVDDPAVAGVVFQPNGLVGTTAGVPINTVEFVVCDDGVTTERGNTVWLSRTGRTGLTRHADASVCNP